MIECRPRKFSIKNQLVYGQRWSCRKTPCISPTRFLAIGTLLVSPVALPLSILGLREGQHLGATVVFFSNMPQLLPSPRFFDDPRSRCYRAILQLPVILLLVSYRRLPRKRRHQILPSQSASFMPFVALGTVLDLNVVGSLSFIASTTVATPKNCSLGLPIPIALTDSNRIFAYCDFVCVRRKKIAIKAGNLTLLGNLCWKLATLKMQ